jgi:hypothetical protein
MFLMNSLSIQILEKISFIRNTQIITDPFPEISMHEAIHPSMRIFAVTPKMVSVHEAYKLGRDQAYKEIMFGMMDFNPREERSLTNDIEAI